MRGDIGVGELGPTPDTCHDDTEVLNLKDTFHEGGGMELLEKPPPPTPCPSDPLLCQHRGSEGSLAPCSLSPVLNRSSKIFLATLLSPLPHALTILPHPTSQSFFSTPLSTMEPFPSTKLRAGWEGPPLLGLAGESHLTPLGGGREGVGCGGGLHLK